MSLHHLLQGDTPSVVRPFPNGRDVPVTIAPVGRLQNPGLSLLADNAADCEREDEGEEEEAEDNRQHVDYPVGYERICTEREDHMTSGGHVTFDEDHMRERGSDEFWGDYVTFYEDHMTQYAVMITEL